MNLSVDLNGISRPARAFLRVVADDRVSSTLLHQAALVIAGRYLGFKAKSSARAQGFARSIHLANILKMHSEVA